MSEEFTIDIDCLKITEWFNDRSQLNQDFNK